MPKEEDMRQMSSKKLRFQIELEFSNRLRDVRTIQTNLVKAITDQAYTAGIVPEAESGYTKSIRVECVTVKIPIEKKSLY